MADRERPVPVRHSRFPYAYGYFGSTPARVRRATELALRWTSHPSSFWSDQLRSNVPALVGPVLHAEDNKLEESDGRHRAPRPAGRSLGCKALVVQVTPRSSPRQTSRTP